MVADTATSLRKGVDLLRTLQSDEALAGGGLGVLRLAELSGLHKSQVSRTLKILAGYGLVDRDSETRAYRLGWTLFALAARAAFGGSLSGDQFEHAQRRGLRRRADALAGEKRRVSHARLTHHRRRGNSH